MHIGNTCAQPAANSTRVHSYIDAPVVHTSSISNISAPRMRSEYLVRTIYFPHTARMRASAPRPFCMLCEVFSRHGITGIPVMREPHRHGLHLIKAVPPPSAAAARYIGYHGTLSERQHMHYAPQALCRKIRAARRAYILHAEDKCARRAIRCGRKRHCRQHSDAAVAYLYTSKMRNRCPLQPLIAALAKAVLINVRRDKRSAADAGRREQIIEQHIRTALLLAHRYIPSCVAAAVDLPLICI